MIDFSRILGGPRTRPHEDAERVAEIRRPYLLEITRALISTVFSTSCPGHGLGTLVFKGWAEEIFLWLERNDFSSEAINAFNCALAQYRQGIWLMAHYTVDADAGPRLSTTLIFAAEQHLELFADPITSLELFADPITRSKE